MGWQRNYVTLNTGARVRYAFVQRDGSDVYFVRFRSVDNRRLEKSTGERKKPQAIDAAHRLILEEYGQIAPSSETVDWNSAKSKVRTAMEADGKRPRTIGGYVETLDKLIAMFPLAKGPSDITDRMAGDFKTKYASGRFTRRKKKEDATEVNTQARKAKSLDSRIRSLKAVFGWFLQLKLVNANPFEKVAPPELDRHEVKYVKQEDLGAFFRWLMERFPGWRMPVMFFSVKALTACRLQDICELRSSQLRDGRLVFAADITKNRSERYALLPPDLYSELQAYKGDSFLWERYPAELKAANQKLGVPTHRQSDEFSTARLYMWVVQLMGKYQEATGNHLSSHDFRKAAFTRAAEEDIHPKRATVAFDVTAETMMKYYTASEKKQTADDVLGGLAAKLLPPLPQAKEEKADNR